MYKRQGEDGVGSKLEWVNLIGNLNASFKNIQDNLAETDRVGGRAGEAAMGISSIPVSYTHLEYGFP